MEGKLLEKLIVGAISGILFFVVGPLIMRVFNGKRRYKDDKNENTDSNKENS